MNADVIVATAHGWLRGGRNGAIISFKGAPYAAPAGGANRFRSPQPVAAWMGVRDARQAGERCIQERESMADAPLFAW